MSETTNGPGTQAGNLCCFRGVALCAVLVPQKIENFADHSDQKMGRHHCSCIDLVEPSTRRISNELMAAESHF